MKRIIPLTMAVLLVAVLAYADCGSCPLSKAAEHEGHDHKEAAAVTEGAAATDIKICPISGKLGEEFQVQHEGKAYNLCCAKCFGKFQEDPAKFMKNAEGKLEVSEEAEVEK